ncbi:MAG: TonB-dependent receptor [Muribaculaceae bacterium]|nr:TonB-dependent receptor [Muribaculaceae bacterium]
MNFRFFMSALFAASTLCALAGATGTIAGVVRDADTRETIPYCAVRVGDRAALTDSVGCFSFGGIAPGTHTVQASYVGYQDFRMSVTLRAGAVDSVAVALRPDAMMLDQVVVTGTKSELKRRHSSSLVNVVSAKTFDLVSAVSLADGLNFQPGVRVENDCQNCGFTQVRINGLDGHYSQILMNSRPVFSALTGVYGLEQIPANMIDRVEVMRGGGSALFGSSAIGGTINIITRDPQENSASVAHTLMSVGPSGSLDNNTTINASVVTPDSRMGVFVYGQSRNRDGYDHDGDGFTEIAALNTQVLGLRAFARPTDLSRFTLEYHATHEYRRGGDNIDLPPHQAMVAEQTDHKINALDLGYEMRTRAGNDRLSAYSAMQHTRRNSYYGSEQDLYAYGRTVDLVALAGAQWTHNFARLWFMPAELVAGAEFNYNHLHDITLGYDHDVAQDVRIYSAYAQNEWRTDRWGFLIGARVDKHNLVRNAIVSPRANIRFNPSPKLNFRLSYSTGFRSPQAYDEDFHVAVVGGERVVTVLAPGLRHESSQSFSGSVDWYSSIGMVQTNLLFEAFYTDLSHVFALRQLDEPDEAGNAVLERYNGSGACVAGLNLEAKAAYGAKALLQLGVTWQRSRYKQPEVWSDNPDVPAEKRMFRTPDVYGYLTATYVPLRRLTCALTGTYTGRMLVQHLAGSGTPVDVAVRTPSFFDANLKFTYEIPLGHKACLDVGVGVMNIFNAYQRDFDQGYLRDSGYIYGPSLPRSVMASVSFSI